MIVKELEGCRCLQPLILDKNQMLKFVYVIEKKYYINNNDNKLNLILNGKF